MPRTKKASPDRRYLWQRGNRWWVQIAVPSALQDRLGKKIIQRPLGVSDINEARRLRWSHVHAIKETYKRALSNEEMTAAEIEDIAQAEYRRIATIENLDLGGDINLALAETISQLAEELEGGESAVSMPDGETIIPDDPMIQRIELESGIKLSPEKRRDLKTAITRAQINAFDAILKRRKGQELDPVPMFNAANRATSIVSRKADAGISMGEARDEYLTLKKPTWTHKTQSQIETSLRLFCEHVGPDTTLADVVRLNVTAWREKMRRLHPRWASSASSKYLSLDELLAAYGQGPETLSDKTLSRHLSAIHGLFVWAIDSGHIDKANPVKVSGSKTTPRHKRGVFSDSEVRKIFQGLRFVTKPGRHTHENALPWLALLGAYSGARLEEICTLRLADIREENSIWFFDIRDSKSSAGVRKVPLHSQVIAVGFLDYVKAHKGQWLFPSLGKPGKDGKRGVYIGKVFAAHCRSAKIDKPLLGFHTWRKTVATKLENAKVPEIEAARLLGHKIKTMSYGVYSGGPGLDELAATVEQIAYEKLTLPKSST